MGGKMEGRARARPGGDVHLRRRNIAAQVADELRQRFNRNDPDTLNERGLAGIDLGHDDGGDVFIVGQADQGQDSVGVAQGAVERKLSEEHHPGKVGAKLPGAEHDTHGDGQVVGRAGFLEVGGGQIDDDTFHGEGTAGVTDSGADALFSFGDSRVRQPDDEEIGEAGRDIDFHLHQGAFQPDDGAGCDFGEHLSLL
jgi:hypothetical protein